MARNVLELNEQYAGSGQAGEKGEFRGKRNEPFALLIITSRQDLQRFKKETNPGREGQDTKAVSGKMGI